MVQYFENFSELM